MDIDKFLKPAGYADFNIVFAEGAMVLAYTTNSKNAATIAAPNGTFNPPGTIPDVAADWYLQLTRPGVAIAGSHPFLDPSGYRADMIFQLTEKTYGVPNLYDTLLSHYSISKSTDALGKTYDYQFIYEHSAFAAYNADATKSYRYVRLPAKIGLSMSELNHSYEDASVTMPDLLPPFAAKPVRVPATPGHLGTNDPRNCPESGECDSILAATLQQPGCRFADRVGPRAHQSADRESS